jgi:hypothetical protein
MAAGVHVRGVWRSQTPQAENPHGCGFSAAQGIEAEILFAGRKKIGADSPVCRRQMRPNFYGFDRLDGGDGLPEPGGLDIAFFGGKK